MQHFQGLDLAIPLQELGEQKSVPDEENKCERKLDTSNTVMTTQEIARWIDTRSRAVFPASFLVFNIFYWTFMFL